MGRFDVFRAIRDQLQITFPEPGKRAAMHFVDTVRSERAVPCPLPTNMIVVECKGVYDLWLRGWVTDDGWVKRYYSHIFGRNLEVYQVQERRFEVTNV